MVHTKRVYSNLVVATSTPFGASSYDRFWPMLLKNSVRVFSATILEVPNHHPISLRVSERDLEGRLFRGYSTLPPQMNFQHFRPTAVDLKAYVAVATIPARLLFEAN